MNIKELAEPNSTLLNELLEDIKKEEISKRTQSRLHHGTQSSGNLFKRPEGSFKTLSKQILLKSIMKKIKIRIKILFL